MSEYLRYTPHSEVRQEQLTIKPLDALRTVIQLDMEGVANTDQLSEQTEHARQALNTLAVLYGTQGEFLEEYTLQYDIPNGDTLSLMTDGQRVTVSRTEQAVRQDGSMEARDMYRIQVPIRGSLIDTTERDNLNTAFAIKRNDIGFIEDYRPAFSNDSNTLSNFGKIFKQSTRDVLVSLA